MKSILRNFPLGCLALAFAFLAILPGAARAQPLGGEPALVTIRFNQPRVYYDQQLYGAISKAFTIKPDVMFDVISCAPATGNADTDKQWQATAGRNTRAVIASMNNIGVPMSRINVTGQSQPGLRHDETQIFVH